MSIDLRREGQVFVLTMNVGENRFNRAFLDAMTHALDEVEQSAAPAALVTTGGDAKFYSNGLDLTWLSGDGSSEGPNFIADVLRFLGRVLAFPVPTVAAINGHAFAAGALLTLAHDFRVMRADRGFFCLPEVDINIPLAPGMTALIQAKLDIVICRDVILTGRRVGGTDALSARIVDEAVGADELLARAVARAESLASKSRETYATLKRGLYRDAVALLAGGALP